MENIKNISIIGAGLMGCGIAQIFASCKDINVSIFDSFLSKKQVFERINTNMKLLEEKSVIEKSDIRNALNRISVFNNLSEAVKNSDFILECIPENMEKKQNLFREIELLCEKDTIFATNTSVMSITEISKKMVNKKRIVGTHFWNPPYLIPLVEVIRSDDTSDEVFENTFKLMKRINKKPIKVNKDVPGFVANRLQHALWREAISIVENEIADAKTVDEAIKMSFGLRLPVLGPLENSDMVGTDLTLSIHEYIFKYIESSKEASYVLREKVKNKDLGFKTGKGFYSWNEEQMNKSKRDLIEHLIKVVYKK
ncbi:MAG: 3-hydroxyacyl-CoA dehydrogenase family protein [Clostridiales bacterium]